MKQIRKIYRLNENVYDEIAGDNCIENTFYWIWWDKINEK